MGPGILECGDYDKNEIILSAAEVNSEFLGQGIYLVSLGACRPSSVLRAQRTNELLLWLAMAHACSLDLH